MNASPRQLAFRFSGERRVSRASAAAAPAMMPRRVRSWGIRDLGAHDFEQVQGNLHPKNASVGLRGG